MHSFRHGAGVGQTDGRREAVKRYRVLRAVHADAGYKFFRLVTRSVSRKSAKSYCNIYRSEEITLICFGATKLFSDWYYM